MTNYVLKFRNYGRYIHFVVSGENTPDNIKGYLNEIRDLCSAHRCPNVLIEESLSGPGLGILDIFEIVSMGSQNLMAMILKIAFVDTNPEHNPDSLKFAETAANNRGISVKMFKNIKEAESWLKDNLI